jgi:ADP-ribosylglycohydrolase
LADQVTGETANDRIAGAILGTAVGDALGLPREGLSRRRARRLFGDPPLRHRFLLGRGMTSDDTEHTCMTGQALLRAPDDPDAFARSLAWRLRFWLLGLPAGTGGATLRAVLKLWLGFSPRRSGVWSAGNGPAMRAALLGVCLGHDRQQMRAYVRASTRLTHTDPRAERGAFLVALTAHHGAAHGPCKEGFPEVPCAKGFNRLHCAGAHTDAAGGLSTAGYAHCAPPAWISFAGLRSGRYNADTHLPGRARQQERRP